MSLKFESISLRNFGPFRNLAPLDISTTEEAPVVVIHGENTMGKTNLFRALRWCLYGEPESRSGSSDAARSLAGYMNRPARAAGEEDFQASIVFSANSQRYYLTRSAKFDSRGNVKVSADLRIDSQVIQQSAIDAEIGRLLHPQISEFFLFDGELLRDFYDRLNSPRERELLRTSIESVLGIPALQLASRDIGVMRDEVLARRTRELKNQAQAESARSKMRALKSEQESQEKDRAEFLRELNKAEESLADIKERIAGVEDLKADAREMEGLESQIRGASALEATLRAEMAELLARGWLAPVGARLESALEAVQERNDAAQLKQAELQKARDRVAVLEKQIQGGICPACSQTLPPPDEATRRSLAEAVERLEYLRREAGDGPDLAAERLIQSLMDRRTIDLYRDKQAQLDSLIATQYERNRRLSAIKDRMKDNDASAIRLLGQQQAALEDAVERYKRQLAALAEKESKRAAEQNKLAGVLRRIGGGAPALAAEAYFFEYVSSLVESTIARYKERTRREVEATATGMFKKLMRNAEAYDGISISRDYHVDLIGKHGPAMKTSEGGRQLIALSLIGALKQAAVRGGPVVLDSPLARLDLEHRENVLNSWVPELGTQAVLLVQSGELTEDQARSIMGNRIGHAYRIYRPNNDPEDAQIERTQ